MDKVKIALIGAGNIANTHLDSYKNVSCAEVYSICDIDEERLNETADKYGISRRYTDIDKMLAELPELDAADVCVWNCSHAECSIKALNAGLHVLCEKPMAYSTEQAVAMKEAADKNGKLLMIGFMMRFATQTEVALDFIKKDYIGEIYYAKAQYVRRHGAPGGWFTDKAKSGGGPVIDLGVHVIDLIRYIMGNPKPVSVYAATFSKLGKRDNLKNSVGWAPKGASSKDICDVEDFGSALIRYDNGAVTHLETSYSINGEDIAKRQVYGTKGGMDLTNGVKIYTECNDFLADIDVNTHSYRRNSNAFDDELAHFVDCIINGTECKAKAEDGIVIMKILDAIYRSAETGHEVVID